MRHFYAYIAAYTLGGLLVVASLFFAWLRSEQYIVVTETEAALRFAHVTSIDEFDWEAYGREGYMTNCAVCHGAEGQGRDVYPPLRAVGSLLAAEGGREYLLDVTLYGLASGRTSAPMPAYPTIPDAQVAALNNYMLTRWGNEALLPADVALYIPQDVAERRGQDLRPWEMAERREALEFGVNEALSPEVIASAGFAWQAQGEELYSEHCSGCHAQVAAAPALLMASSGREYLIDLVLYGAALNGRDHPSYGDWSDEELAAVLNATIARSGRAEGLEDDAELIRAEEVEAARGQGLSPAEVADERPDID